MDFLLYLAALPLLDMGLIVIVVTVAVLVLALFMTEMSPEARDEAIGCFVIGALVVLGFSLAVALMVAMQSLAG